MIYFPDNNEMDELKQFVAAHSHAAPPMLRLRYHRDNRPWVPLAINHIESLSKKYKKLNDLQPEFIPIPLAV